MLRARTLLINTARGIAQGFGVRLPQSITARFGVRALAELPEFLKTALGGLLEQSDSLSRQVADSDQRILTAAAQHAEVQRLTSIPGVGTLTALTFVLTLGRAERFAHSRDVAGFLGLRPKQRQSGARDPQLGISQKWRSVFAEAAGAVLALHPGVWGAGFGPATRGLSKAAGGKKASLRAIVAVARK